MSYMPCRWCLYLRTAHTISLTLGYGTPSLVPWPPASSSTPTLPWLAAVSAVSEYWASVAGEEVTTLPHTAASTSTQAQVSSNSSSKW